MGNLGNTLKERRTALGLSIEQVEAATRIRGALIRALEEGDYGRLPNPGYVRGYISSYSRFLELDPKPLLQMYKAETGIGQNSNDLNLPQVDEAVAPRNQQHAVPARTALIAVVVIALLSVSVWGVMRIWRGPDPTPPEPSQLTEPTSTTEPEDDGAQGSEDEGEQQAEDEGSADGATETEQTTEAQPFTLEVRVSNNGASWLEIAVDGKSAYVGTLTGGQSKRYEVTENATVLIGRPSVVTVLRDGEKVDIPTSSGTPTLELEAETGN